MAFWKPISGIGSPVSIRDFRGVNKLDAFSIAEGQFASVKNVTSTAFPAITVRPGFSNIGTSLGAAISGLGVWKDSELHAIAGGNWKKYSSGAWSAALATGLATDRASFCNFKGNLSGINLIMANGTDAKKYDGSTVSDLGDAPAGLNYIDSHDNRIYGAVSNSIYFCALNKPEDWTTVDDGTGVGSGQIVIDNSMGELINGIKAGPGHVVAFMPHSTHELYGTGPHNYQKIPVSEEIGCISNAAAEMVGGVLIWPSHRGIEQYSGGVAPSNNFSMPVQWYMDNINQANKAKSCSGTDGRFYRLAIPLQANTEPSHILEYDSQFGIWYVQEIGNPKAFASMQEGTYIGDNTGQVKLLGGTTDAGTAIAWELISKPFGAGSLAQRKQWYDLWITVDVSTGSTMNMYLSKTVDGEDWTLVKSITANSELQSTRAIIPVGAVANANWIRFKISGSGPVTLYEVTRKERLMPYF